MPGRECCVVVIQTISFIQKDTGEAGDVLTSAS